jgi:uncharacterized protein YeaO (DUF488 family)
LIAVKNVAEAPAPADGIRVLVERRWPPGRSREEVPLDLWLRDAAPSEALRARWRGGALEWEEFVRRYRDEMAGQDDLIRLLRELCRRAPLTLLHSAGNAARNHAVALQEMLHEPE